MSFTTLAPGEAQCSNVPGLLHPSPYRDNQAARHLGSDYRQGVVSPELCIFR